MTTPIVMSITDELLAEIEEQLERCSPDDIEAHLTTTGEVAGLLARLRAAEKDAARLNWLDGQCESYGYEDVHEGNRWVMDGPYAAVRQAIDAAMERQP